jgi:hypothetical protein
MIGSNGAVFAARFDLSIGDKQRAIPVGFKRSGIEERITRGMKQGRPQNFAPFGRAH